MLTILVSLYVLVSLAAAVLGYLMYISGPTTISDGSQPTKARNIKPTPSTPNLTELTEVRWWANHPWMTFLCFISLHYFLAGLGLLWVTVYLSMLLPIIFILCFIRGVFLTWQRSKIRAVLIAVGVPLIVGGLLAAIAIPQKAAYRRRRYDGDVKANIRNAATAQEFYFEATGTYTNKIGSLIGFNQGDNVNITMEATTNTFVISGEVKKGCSVDSGIWHLDGSTGKITGTPCD